MKFVVLCAVLFLTPSCAFVTSSRQKQLHPTDAAAFVSQQRVLSSESSRRRLYMAAPSDEDIDNVVFETNAALEAAKSALEDVNESTAAQEITTIKSMPSHDDENETTPPSLISDSSNLQHATMETLKAFGGVVGGLAMSIAESVVEEVKTVKVESKMESTAAEAALYHEKTQTPFTDSVTSTPRSYATLPNVASKSRLYMVDRKNEDMVVKDSTKRDIDEALQVAKEAIQGATKKMKVGPATNDFTSTSPYKVSLKHMKVKSSNSDRIKSSKDDSDLQHVAIGALKTVGGVVGAFSMSIAQSVVEEMKTTVPGKVDGAAVLTAPTKNPKDAAVGALKSFGGALGGFAKSVADIAVKEVKKVPRKIANEEPRQAVSKTEAKADSSNHGTDSLVASMPSSSLKEKEMDVLHQDVDGAIQAPTQALQDVDRTIRASDETMTAKRMSTSTHLAASKVSLTSQVANDGESAALRNETNGRIGVATKVGTSVNENTSKVAKLVPDEYFFTSNSPYKVLPKVGSKHASQSVTSVATEERRTEDSLEGTAAHVKRNDALDASAATASEVSASLESTVQSSTDEGVSAEVKTPMTDSSSTFTSELKVESVSADAVSEPSIVARLRRGSKSDKERHREDDVADIDDLSTTKDPDLSFLHSLNSSSKLQAVGSETTKEHAGENGVIAASGTTLSTESKEAVPDNAVATQSISVPAGVKEVLLPTESVSNQETGMPKETPSLPPSPVLTTSIDLSEEQVTLEKSAQPATATTTTTTAPSELAVIQGLKRASLSSHSSKEMPFDEDEATDSLRRYIQARARDMTLRRLDRTSNAAVPTFIAPIVEDPYEPKEITTAATMVANSLKRHGGVVKVAVSRKAQRSVLLAAAATGALVVGKRLLSVALGGGLL